MDYSKVLSVKGYVRVIMIIALGSSTKIVLGNLSVLGGVHFEKPMVSSSHSYVT